MQARRFALPAAFAVVVAGLVYLGYENHHQSQELKALQWANTVDWETRNENSFGLDVGSIQFLRNGYSLTLEAVTYEADGLKLVGRLGNPKAVNVSSLTLTFSVKRPLRQYREQYMKDPFLFWANDSIQVGRAQVAVGTLEGGAETHFEILIPNVKQSSERYTATVDFGGERYSYPR